MRKTALIILIVLLIIGAVSGGVYIFLKSHNQSVISKQVLKKVSFTIYGPDQDPKQVNVWRIDNQKTSYSTDTGVLTLQTSKGNTTIILNEQSTPDSFNDIPQQYSRMLNLLNQYAEVKASFGTITLTKPKELQGGQSAVVNKSGTLLFAKPNRALSDAEWKDYFDTFIIIR